MATITSGRPRTGLTALVQRHPIAVFPVLALGSVYVLSVIPILMQYDVIPGKDFPSRLGLDMERFSAAGLTLLLFSSALLVTYLEGGRSAVRQLFRRILRWRVGIGWWLVALVALPMLTVIFAVLLGDTAAPPAHPALESRHRLVADRLAGPAAADRAHRGAVR